MKNLYADYIMEINKYLKENNKDKKDYTFQEIDKFHDSFCKKYNITDTEFEKMITDNYYKDSIDLFVG
ncbi:hypothetical protein [Cetobacterium sp.]|uniref:hypothetical protein n=1 Tax=Cetobacterium sp. TaxID=2071632 RepID=UPI003F3FF007